jgi:hypothetical protein
MLSEFGLFAVGLSDSRMKIEIEVTAHIRLRQLGGGDLERHKLADLLLHLWGKGL